MDKQPALIENCQVCHESLQPSLVIIKLYLSRGVIVYQEHNRVGERVNSSLYYCIVCLTWAESRYALIMMHEAKVPFKADL